MFRASWLAVPTLGQDLFLQSASESSQLVKDVMHKRLEMLGVDHDQAHELSSNMAKHQMPVWKREHWTTSEHSPYQHPDGYEVKKVTYTSPEMRLSSGGAHFTLNPLTHSPFPMGDYSLISNSYRVVSSDGNREIPLSEVYLHHWLMGSSDSVNPLLYCENDYYWGYGAEMRNMDYQVPKGYAMKRIGSKGYCGLNMHFINTEDLKLEWEGLNNPNGSWGAAAKNCMECGWAPHRAPECLQSLDGTFGCCFTYSRCPVNNPRNHKRKSYRLQYDIEYTEDLAALKPLRGVVLDVSGGAVEWNISPNMSPRARTVCDDKVCKTENSWTVGEQRGFGNGICSGTMLWSYMHQHLGAINGTFAINDEHYCTSLPVVGTNASNPPGDEKGYVVKFTSCVDKDELGNHVRLNKGDVITAAGYYDVDVNSVANAPMPGGKHGGVMGLFFAMMDCDPGTFSEIYVCRQAACVPTYPGNVDTSEQHFGTLGDCQAACS